jgi:hypothetical protein
LRPAVPDFRHNYNEALAGKLIEIAARAVSGQNCFVVNGVLNYGPRNWNTVRAAMNIQSARALVLADASLSARFSFSTLFRIWSSFTILMST